MGGIVFLRVGYGIEFFFGGVDVSAVFLLIGLLNPAQEELPVGLSSDGLY